MLDNKLIVEVISNDVDIIKLAYIINTVDGQFSVLYGSISNLVYIVCNIYNHIIITRCKYMYKHLPFFIIVLFL